jgi:uncharacterized membrane protein YkgB
MAYRYLKHLIAEIEKYGKLEGWQKRIETHLTSLKGIIEIIAVILTIAGILWGIFG